MSTTAVTHDDLLELSRRALIADFGATLAEQPEFRRHAEVVSEAMPARWRGRSINAAGASSRAAVTSRSSWRGAMGKAASARQSSPSSCARPPPRCSACRASGLIHMTGRSWH